MEKIGSYRGFERRHAFVAYLILSLVAFSCSKDDDPSSVYTGNAKSFTLPSLYGGPVSGELTIRERTDNKVELEVVLTGTSASHPTHIHLNTWAEGGDIVIDFDESVVVIDKLASGASVTYNDLLNFDGFLAVHESANNLGAYLILADIGQNALTGKSKTYNLNNLNGVPNGSIKFEERVNGETLVTINMTTGFSGEQHPAHIHNGSLASPGSIATDLNLVSPTTGLSFTNVTKVNNTAVTYSGLLAFDGYAAVHASAADLNPISLGNVGKN